MSCFTNDYQCVLRFTKEQRWARDSHVCVYFTIDNICIKIIIAAKVGIKSCRFAIECVSFVHAWM